ncbi:acyl-CoA thioester hydrolase/BAAT C-terminal domain-containing protein [Natronorubrum texcoconense]|uniref:Dienelactone hydrolase n=1 Tax=Natronorubrum texcoconense TaxID=1095776 RepID=A0A1G8U202_9EURY|nr:acyl-CoA thioester hydrolase/BAAT C-terminal domain-containing protein [Natronorubrum texcoconense]SDJ47763.1 Dienelactone hydrolase [Natronorubrum texcoconense]
MRDRSYSRRRTVATLGTALAAGVAGCCGDDSDDGIAFDHPQEVRPDEPFDLTVDGLSATTELEVTLEWPEGGSDAISTLETDGEGRLDLSSARVVDGHVPADLDVPIPVALIQCSYESFWEYLPSGEERLTYSVGTEDERFGSTELRRRHPDPEAAAEPDHAELVGDVFEPLDGDGGPGILVLHGSDGRPLIDHALQLAQRRYTAFALQYFGAGGLPDDLVEIPLEYVETAAEWLLDRDGVIGDRVGVIGMSKGGELALLAGSQFDAIGPVVSIVGSGLVWEGGATVTDPPETSSWSLGGEPIPYVPYHDGVTEEGLSGREFFVESLEAASAETIDAATIPVERIDGNVVLVSGGDDELWPTARLHETAVERFESQGRRSFEHLVYETAGHGIYPPYRPVRGTTAEEFGGSLAGNARAAHEHWPHVLEAFSTIR